MQVQPSARLRGWLMDNGYAHHVSGFAVEEGEIERLTAESRRTHASRDEAYHHDWACYSILARNTMTKQTRDELGGASLDMDRWVKTSEAQAKGFNVLKGKFEEFLDSSAQLAAAICTSSETAKGELLEQLRQMDHKVEVERIYSHVFMNGVISRMDAAAERKRKERRWSWAWGIVLLVSMLAAAIGSFAQVPHDRIILRAQDEGGTLAGSTRDAGLWVLNCAGAGVACSWSGSTLTLTASGGGGSPLTTKGDLFTFTTVDARLAVGANGLCLTADSAQTTGLLWATCGSGAAHNLLSATHSDTLAGTVVLGDTIFGNGTPAWARLAGNTTTARQVLSQTGTGAVSAAPVWISLIDSDIPDTITLTNLTQITNRAISDTTGTLLEGRGGTGESTYTLGDVLYSDAANSLAKLAGNITTAKQFLTQTGTGAVSAAPVWGTIADGDIPAAIARDAEINVQGTANEITSTGAGVAPTLSLAAQLNVSGKEIIGGATPVRFEGLTDDNFYSQFTFTDPTATRTHTFPNADSNTVQPDAGAANNFLTAISALGVISKAQPAFTNLSGTFADAQVPATLDLNNNVLQGASPLVLEGLTVDAFETTIAVTDPTAARTVTLPNADSNTVQPLTCGGTDKVSAIAGTGVITCTADQGGAGGDSMEVEDGDNAGTFTAIVTTGRFEDSADINFVNTTNDISGVIRADSVGMPADTTGNYIASLTNGTGLTGFPAAAENATGTPAFDFSQTLAGNPAFNAEECVSTLDGTGGGGFLCEGNVGANTNEQLHLFPALDGVDTTDFIATATSSPATVGQVLRVTGTGTGNWGALDLADADAITGDIPDANLSAAVSLLGQTIDDTEMTAEDFGSFTCTAGEDGCTIDAGSVDSGKLAVANKQLTKSIPIFDPTTALTNKVQFYWAAAVTLQEVTCSSLPAASTVTIQLDERAEATPNMAGTNSLTASLVCDDTSETTTAFADSAIAAEVPHNLQIISVAGTPTAVRIHIRAQIN